MFFYGDFKVIIQNQYNFIFNLKHGRIYHLNKNKIGHIGTIFVDENYPKIQENKLIIEDRDNLKILVFAPVLWEKDIEIKPDIQTVAAEEFGNRFLSQ